MQAAGTSWPHREAPQSDAAPPAEACKITYQKDAQIPLESALGCAPFLEWQSALPGAPHNASRINTDARTDPTHQHMLIKLSMHIAGELRKAPCPRAELVARCCAALHRATAEESYSCKADIIVSQLHAYE
jgi:hypothetical protein